MRLAVRDKEGRMIVLSQKEPCGVLTLTQVGAETLTLPPEDLAELIRYYRFVKMYDLPIYR